MPSFAAGGTSHAKEHWPDIRGASVTVGVVAGTALGAAAGEGRGPAEGMGGGVAATSGAS